MFPDIRLMIAAVMATIVGISCGLGLLAVFRINHDPYARLPSAGPPLQLVFGNAAPAPVTDATTAPFGVRFQSQAPQPVSAREPATEPPPLPSSSDNATMAPPSPTAPDSETTQDAVANAVAESAVEQTALAEQTIEAAKLLPEPDATSVKLAAAKRDRLAAKPRRVRKARAAAAQPADQNAGLAQPGYAFTALQPAKTRRSANP